MLDDIHTYRKFGNNSTTNLIGVHPLLVFLSYEALYHSPYDIGIHCGVRGEEQQRRNVDIGVSWTMDSKHRPRVFSGLKPILSGAIDFHVYDGTDSHFHLASLEKVWLEAWLPLSELYKIPLVWGGNWRGKKRDGPHIELGLKSKLWIPKERE